MKPFIASLLLFAVSWSAAPLAADEAFDINVYTAPRLEGAKVDGRLDEPAWQLAPLAGGFRLYGTDTACEPPTFFRVAFDADFLYLGVNCDEPEMKQFAPEAQARDAHAVFHGETIELFIDPAHSHTTYYQIAVNAAGSIYDSCGEEPAWSAAVQAAASTSPTGWSLEIAVPWKDLGVTPRAGHLLGLNVCRDRYIGNRQWSNWARVTTGFHDPIRFGHVILEGTPAAISDLGSELRKGDRSGAITLFTRAGLAETTYRALAEAGLKSLQEQLAALTRQAEQEPSPACKAELTALVQARQAEGLQLAERLAGQASLDARQWHELDRQLGTARQTLAQAVWTARLNALLGDL
jgi:hypothetical protein